MWRCLHTKTLDKYVTGVCIYIIIFTALVFLFTWFDKSPSDAFIISAFGTATGEYGAAALIKTVKIRRNKKGDSNNVSEIHE